MGDELPVEESDGRGAVVVSVDSADGGVRPARSAGGEKVRARGARELLDRGLVGWLFRVGGVGGGEGNRIRLEHNGTQTFPPQLSHTDSPTHQQRFQDPRSVPFGRARSCRRSGLVVLATSFFILFYFIYFLSFILYFTSFLYLLPFSKASKRCRLSLVESC